jgi:hypothetical protein
MANPTMTLIASSTVGSGGAPSVTFSPIPATYTDLKIVSSVRSDRSANINDYLKVGFNGTTTNISYIALEGNGTSASSFDTATAAQFIGEIPAATATANTFANFEMYIPNYASSNNKSYSVDIVSENNGTGGFQNLIAGLWSSTAAITSMTFSVGFGTNLVANSTFYLYGIKNS